MFAIKWGGYSAMETAAPLWQRVAGWAVLAVLLAALVGLTGFGVIMIGAGCGTLGPDGLGLVMIGFGLLLFVYPVQAIRACFRRKRETGSLRVTHDELTEMRLQQTARNNQERRKPLGSKIVSSLFLVAILVGWGLWGKLDPPKSRPFSWDNLALWSLFAIYVIWNQFRKPQRARSSDSI
jgi:hypothetical protein